MVEITNPSAFRQPDPPLSVGAVLRKTIQVFATAPTRFLALSAAKALPQIINVLTVINEGHTAVNLAMSVVQSVLTCIIMASIAYGTFHQLREGQFDLRDAWRVGLRRFVPVFLASLLSAIIVGLGFIALVVPGVMALCALVIVIPVCTIEGLGPVESLRRSADLTRGSRWRLFGALVTIIVATLIAFFVFGGIAVLIGGEMLEPSGKLVLVLIVGILMQILAIAFHGIFAAVLYDALQANRASTEPVPNTID